MLKKILLFYIVTSIGAGAMGAFQSTLGLDNNIIELAQFGPTLGVLALLIVYGAKRISLKTDLAWHAETPRNIGIAVGLPVLAFAMTLLMYKLSGQHIDYVSPTHISAAPYLLVLILAIVGAGLEELGWRSWLQPFLETKYSVLLSSVIVGFLWSIWHIGGFAFGLGFMALFTVMAIGISVVLGQLLRGERRNNLVVATLLHAATNTYLLLFFGEEKGNLFAIASIASSWVIIAIATCILTRAQASVKRVG